MNFNKVNKNKHLFTIIIEKFKNLVCFFLLPGYLILRTLTIHKGLL